MTRSNLFRLSLRPPSGTRPTVPGAGGHAGGCGAIGNGADHPRGAGDRDGDLAAQLSTQVAGVVAKLEDGGREAEPVATGSGCCTGQ